MSLTTSKSPPELSSYLILAAIDDNIDSQQDSQRIVVRFLHSWEARNFKRNNVLLSIECFLLDEKDNVIQASIHLRCLHKFKTKLNEDNLLSISCFDVKNQLDRYRLTDHGFKILFNDLTIMDAIEVDNYKIPHEYYRIHLFELIKMMVDKGEILPDNMHSHLQEGG
ncbi:hypothetical protein V5N11_016059 [Cardamine amara subsp. amara]|uniref:Replication protein A 70 kDa DNA-binding subunit B/D first OB fold domain-containing protein n=1 Tax=Cardamine amara subsp. amara TaxID=228776 RepID=A0ABD1B607_CARAN